MRLSRAPKRMLTYFCARSTLALLCLCGLRTLRAQTGSREVSRWASTDARRVSSQLRFKSPSRCRSCEASHEVARRIFDPERSRLTQQRIARATTPNTDEVDPGSARCFAIPDRIANHDEAARWDLDPIGGSQQRRWIRLRRAALVPGVRQVSTECSEQDLARLVTCRRDCAEWDLSTFQLVEKSDRTRRRAQVARALFERTVVCLDHRARGVRCFSKQPQQYAIGWKADATVHLPVRNLPAVARKNALPDANMVVHGVDQRSIEVEQNPMLR
jgi:hypothetical protein